MSMIARQFAGPSGMLGNLVTRLLARGNGDLNRWAVATLAASGPAPAVAIEVGSGPGIALAELARLFPAAHVIGVDPSGVVNRAARRRNAAAIAEGRVSLVRGDVSALRAYGPADLVLAVHVIYFWEDPVRELRRIHEVLTPGGRVALGYQLRRDMPQSAQREFPKAGYTLYDSDEAVTSLLVSAGFASPEVRVLGTPERPGGRLAIGSA
ncbi:MAG TPA: class I SAM-dependent methyltransferase [Propionibacteriaceae bacterium]|nr:class I SAM-dependent methyltransferase [Propionibacteriaceae bacterium]